MTDLEQNSADLSGLEAALFMPSGTMANQVAIRCWTEPGDEVIMESGAHPFHYEAGGAAVISGAQIRLIQGERGVFGPETLLAALRGPDDHYAPARLVCVEDTSNRGGGTVWPLAPLDAVCAAAQDAGLKVHMDGARVFPSIRYAPSMSFVSTSNRLITNDSTGINCCAALCTAV